MEKEDINIGGSIFWIMLILIAISGLIYLMLWSFANDSIQGAITSMIFITMITSGILLSRMKVFDFASWGDNALSFTLGFGLFMTLGLIFKTSQSTIDITVPPNLLFATLSQKLPVLVNITLNNFVIPIAEELFWLIGIPYALFTIMNLTSKMKGLEFFGNQILQLFIVITISSVSFALFHVSKMLIGFIIAAIIFRTILISMIYGDQKFDIIKGVNLVGGFGIGAHMANNIVDKGVVYTWSIITQSTTITIIIVAFLGILFISAINRLLEFFVGDRKDLMDRQ